MKRTRHWQAQAVPIGSLGFPDLQVFTPKQEKVLKKIDDAQESLIDIRKQITDAVQLSGEPLAPDRVEAILQQNPWWKADLAEAGKKYAGVMRKAVRVGLDTFPYTLAKCTQLLPHETAECATCTRNTAICTWARAGLIGDLRVREWINSCQALHDESRKRFNVLRPLLGIRSDLLNGMRKPIMPATDVALNEVWCCLKREGKSGEQIFNAIKEMRKRGELKARKQNSPEALRKWAKEHRLPELLKMELELEQQQPMIEQLLAKNASFQEALEQLHPALQAKNSHTKSSRSPS